MPENTDNKEMTFALREKTAVLILLGVFSFLHPPVAEAKLSLSDLLSNYCTGSDDEHTRDAVLQGVLAKNCRVDPNTAKEIVSMYDDKFRPVFDLQFTQNFERQFYVTAISTAVLALAVQKAIQPGVKLDEGEILSEACGSKCSPEAIKIAGQILTEALPQIKKLQKISDSEFAKSIDKNLDQMNHLLSNMNVPIRTGKQYGSRLGIVQDAEVIPLDSKGQLSEVSNPDWIKYANLYRQTALESGMLLYTKRIQNKFGSLRTYSDGVVRNKWDSTGVKDYIPLHTKITESDVNQTRKDLVTGIKDQISRLNDMYEKSQKRMDEASPTLREADLESLIKINPILAGEFLAKQIKYFRLVCDALDNISQDNQRIKGLFALGGFALGGVLSVSGIGAPEGLGMLAIATRLGASMSAAYMADSEMERERSKHQENNLEYSIFTSPLTDTRFEAYHATVEAQRETVHDKTLALAGGTLMLGGSYLLGPVFSLLK